MIGISFPWKAPKIFFKNKNEQTFLSSANLNFRIDESTDFRVNEKNETKLSKLTKA